MSSNEPKPFSYPWAATKLPGVDQYRYTDFRSADPSGGYAKYSELQKPYAYDEDIPEDYVWWEYVWPDINFPKVSIPDPIEGDCKVDEDCNFAKIIGPNKLRCGQCNTWTQYHQWIGCTAAPWWAAFGSWEIIDPIDGVVMITQGPVMATVCANDDANPGTFKLRYNGPLNCVDEISVEMEDCGCCKDFTLTGNETVNPGSQWTGLISPACQDAECSVVSNSGCTLTCSMNGSGSEVYVTPGALDCGSFTVTITYSVEDCIEKSASWSVRINDLGQGGGWIEIELYEYSVEVYCLTNTECTNHVGTYVSEDLGCVDENDQRYKYGRSYTCGGGDECCQTILQYCWGCEWQGCTNPDPSTNAPVPPANCLRDVYGDQFEQCVDYGDGCGAGHTECAGGGGYETICRCTEWSYGLCEWKCTC